jgi:hypothetical protein
MFSIGINVNIWKKKTIFNLIDSFCSLDFESGFR